jgi:hypothetical protein
MSVSRRGVAVANQERLVRLCLGALILGLLLVGLVSGTLLRHLVQVLPAAIALGLVWRRVPWATYSALPVFLFWLLVMLLIWLSLLGVASIITGTFSAAERILTLAIGLSAIVGSAGVLRTAVDVGWAKRALVFLAFAVFQVAAMWASLQPVVSHR